MAKCVEGYLFKSWVLQFSSKSALLSCESLSVAVGGSVKYPSVSFGKGIEHGYEFCADLENPWVAVLLRLASYRIGFYVHMAPFKSTCFADAHTCFF